MRDPGAMRRWVLRGVLFVVAVLICDRVGGMFLRRGLDRYFGLDKQSEILLVGHSRTVLGIDDVFLARELRVSVSKYAFAGANVMDRNAMTRQFVNTRSRPPRLVVYDVDASMFSTGELSEGSYSLFFPYWDQPDAREHIQRCAPKGSSLMVPSLLHLPRYDETLLALSIRGHLDIRANLKTSSIEFGALNQRIQQHRVRPMTIEDSAVAAFEDAIAFCENNGLVVVLAYIPTVDVLNNLDRAAHDRAIAKVKSYADASPNVHYLDYNTAYESRHDLFFDGIHLNAAGCREITRLLARDLAAILPSRPR